MVTTEKYIHTEEVHNLTSPGIVVPFLVELFQPKSVVDIGCGLGTFLNIFKQHGIEKVVGADGTWVEADQLCIHTNEFIEADLEKPFHLSTTFDMALCLEVAEHLSPDAADVLVQSLAGLSKVIIFSAAVSLQGGQNHLNEQPFSYWQNKFRQHGYSFYDVFRSKFWNNENVSWWYKQNMFAVLHDSIEVPQSILDMKVDGDASVQIHPDLLGLHVRQKNNALKKVDYLKNKLERIKKGQEVWQLYGSIFWNKCKSILK